MFSHFCTVATRSSTPEVQNPRGSTQEYEDPDHSMNEFGQELREASDEAPIPAQQLLDEGSSQEPGHGSVKIELPLSNQESPIPDDCASGSDEASITRRSSKRQNLQDDLSLYYLPQVQQEDQKGTGTS